MRQPRWRWPLEDVKPGDGYLDLEPGSTRDRKTHTPSTNRKQTTRSLAFRIENRNRPPPLGAEQRGVEPDFTLPPVNDLHPEQPPDPRSITPELESHRAPALANLLDQCPVDLAGRWIRDPVPERSTNDRLRQQVFTPIRPGK